MPEEPGPEEDLKEEVRRLTEMYLETSQIVRMGMKGAMTGARAARRARADAARR